MAAVAIMRMQTLFEKEVERNHSRLARSVGWFVEKIMRTARGGFPDRFYARSHPKDQCPFCNRGRVVLIEWKRFGKTAEPQQLLRHKQLREAGVEVYVVDNTAEANRILGIGNR